MAKGDRKPGGMMSGNPAPFMNMGQGFAGMFGQHQNQPKPPQQMPDIGAGAERMAPDPNTPMGGPSYDDVVRSGGGGFRGGIFGSGRMMPQVMGPNGETPEQMKQQGDRGMMGHMGMFGGMGNRFGQQKPSFGGQGMPFQGGMDIGPNQPDMGNRMQNMAGQMGLGRNRGMFGPNQNMGQAIGFGGMRRGMFGF